MKVAKKSVWFEVVFNNLIVFKKLVENFKKNQSEKVFKKTTNFKNNFNFFLPQLHLSWKLLEIR